MTSPSELPTRFPAAAAVADNDLASRFKAAADLVPVMIWMAGSDRVCDWFNQRWLQFTGRSMAHELGTGWLDAVHPEDLQRCIGIYAVSFDACLPFEMEYRLRRHDGAYRWILDHGVPHHSSDGRLTRYVGCCLDIDERRALEDRLALRTESLRLSERRRDAFLTALVEELGASLASAQQTLLALDAPGSAPDAVAAAMRLTATLQTQLDRLLAEARRTARSVAAPLPGDRPATRVDALLRLAVAAVPAPLLLRPSRLRLTAPDSSPSIATDPRLAHMLGRLIEAALESSDAASTLAVRADVDEQSRALLIRLSTDRGSFSPEFIPLALGYFNAQEAHALNPGAQSMEAIDAAGAAAFCEPGAQAVTFFIGKPWIEGPAS